MSLAEALAPRIEEAHAAWPGLPRDPAFAEYVAARLGPEPAPEAALADVHVPDLLLAWATLRGVPAATEAFERLLGRAVAAAVGRTPGAAALGDEVAQRLRVRLLCGAPPQLERYAGRGRLEGFLRTSAARDALKLARRPPSSDGDALDLLADAADDPELGHMKRLYRAELRAAFGEALRSLDTRQRALLKLALVDGRTVDDVGAIYRVHRATAARWIAAARAELRARTQQALGERLRVDGPDAASIVRLVQSQLEVTVRSLLRG